ncbi:MAG: DnaJ domain-containing protein [Bdellovibrionales bacterium]|nr:DnaJ domain-containing protein [Bdellovibrionales bacterium]
MKKTDVFSVFQHIFQYVLILLFSFFCIFSYAETYYEILGVSPNASQKELKDARNSLVREYHPDKHPNASESRKKELAEKTAEINRIYEELSNPETRRAYDADLRSRQNDNRVFQDDINFEGRTPPPEEVKDARDLKDLYLKEARPVEIQTRPLENPYEVLEVERNATEMQINRGYSSLDRKLRRDLHKQFRRLHRTPRDSAEKAPLEQKIDQIIQKLHRLYSAHQVLSHSVLREQWDRDGRMALRGTFLSFKDMRTGLFVHYFEGYDGKLYDIAESNDGRRIHLIRRMNQAPPFIGSETHITDVLRLDTTLKYAGESFENMKDIEKPNIAELEAKESKTSQLLNKYREIIRDRVARVMNQKRNMDGRGLPVVSASDGSSRSQSSSHTGKNLTRPGQVTFKASPSQLTFETLDRMIHPFAENSTHQLKLTEAMRQLPPNMLSFYAALGAYMFSRTYWDSHTYDGVEVDPEWEQSIVTAISTPLGLFSLAAFVVVSGQVTRGIEVAINKYVNVRKNKDLFMNVRGSKLTPDNVAASRKYFEEIETSTRRATNAIRSLRMPLSLSAGMMVSMAIMELNYDPNAIACWDGMREPNKRGYNFMSACDRFYQDWSSFIEFLIVTPMTFGALVGANKWVHPNKRALAKGVIGMLWIAMMTFEINGEFQDWGKLKEWAPMMATMIAAGLSLQGLGWSLKKIKGIYDAFQLKKASTAQGSSSKTKNTNPRISTNTRPQALLEDISNNRRSLSRVANTIKNGTFSAGKRSLLFMVSRFGGFFSSAFSIGVFIALDHLWHPLIGKKLRDGVGKDIVYKKDQLNSYITGSGTWSDQKRDFTFWELWPDQECSISNPAEMGYVELIGEVAFNNNRRNCAGRFLAHQLDDFSSLFSDWRENQLGMFPQKYGNWSRDISPLLFWHNENMHILESTGILPEGRETNPFQRQVKQIEENWTGIQYHNLSWGDPRKNIKGSDEIKRIKDDLLMNEEKRLEIEESTVSWYLFEYGSEEDVQLESIQDFRDRNADAIENLVRERIYITLFLIDQGVDESQITDEMLLEVSQNKSDELEQFKQRKDQEMQHQYYSERVQSKVMEVVVRENYLNLPYNLFKWAVNELDQYIAEKGNSSEFLLNKEILSDIYDSNYLNFKQSANLSEEETVGSLRALFNAVDFSVPVYNYYDRRQIEECERNLNCNEAVLRARAVSAGVDLLNLVSGFYRAGGGEWGASDHWEFIADIRNSFKDFLNGKDPRTYSTPFAFNSNDQIMESGIEYQREGKGWFAPLMDGLPAHPMKHVVYQMVCGAELNSYFPPIDQTCTDQDDLNQLAEELPSIDKVFNKTSYILNIPKIIRGEAPAGICDKSPSKAFDTPIIIGNKRYQNLLEYVLDFQNIRSDIDQLWEEKVESQYSLLMACFEDLYGKIYNNHFLKPIHSKEVYTVNTAMDNTAAYSSSFGGAPVYPVVSQSVPISAEVPKGVLESLMNQTEFLFDLLKRVYTYNGEILPERVKTIESAWNNLDGARTVLPHICKEQTDFTSLQEKAYMSIECSEKLTLDLFESIAEQIKVEQCGSLLQFEVIEIMGDRFTYIQEHMRFLMISDLDPMLPPDYPDDKVFARADCFVNSTNKWCDMYSLRPRDTATLLIAKHHLGQVFRDLMDLYTKVTFFSGNSTPEECDSMQNEAERVPLIQEVIDEYPKLSLDEIYSRAVFNQ